MDNVCCCIPARYQSSRLPGKLMYKLGEKTLLQLTYEKVSKVKEIQKIYILVDDDILYRHAITFCSDVIMTSKDCMNGSERISKYLNKIDFQYTIIVNVQADEPCIDPRNISYAINKHLFHINDKKVFYTTLHMCLDKTEEEYLRSTACLKVVVDNFHNAMYYSRAIIPYNKEGIILDYVDYKTFTGIYVFNRDLLKQYCELENTHLQMLEDIEQLKILEHGYKIKTYRCPYFNEISINTPEDYEKIKRKLENT